jgi:hypothetical protein
MSVSVTLTIPNKATHISDRDTLQGNQTVYEKSITELTNTRRDLLTQQQPTAVANITLDDAVTRLEKYQHDVGEYNQKCQTTQNRININNYELQQLLDRIQLEKDAALAEKAVADAAAAKTAADQAAALQSANRALQEYIATLQEQLVRINQNNLDDIAGQIQGHVDTVKTFGTELDVAVATPPTNDAISQDTTSAIAAFKAATKQEGDSTIRSLNALKREFDSEKLKLVAGLNTRIQELNGVAAGANVTAKQITDALDADKRIPPIHDISLGEINKRAAKLATDIGTKATVDLHKRKAEIDRLIDADKASFQEKQKITEEFKKITDIFDSKEFKDKEATIRANIFTASEAHKVVVNDKGNDINKHLANTKFGTAITGLNASIFSLETELNKIHNLEPTLQELQARSAKIQQPPIDVAPIQVRLDELKKAKNEYDRLNLAQQARAKELTAKRSTQPAIQPSPPAVPRPLSALQRVAPRAFNKEEKEEEIEGADPMSAPLEPTRTPGRRYSIFIPTPTTLKEPFKSPSRVEAATVVTGNIAEDDIDPTVLEIFVYEDAESASAGASAEEMDSSSKRGGGGGGGRRRGVLRSQRGGAPPPKVAKIIKVSEITPEIQNLFLSFESPNKVLTPEFLKKIEEHRSSKIIAIPRDIDDEMTKVKTDELIDDTDDTPFFENLGQKASHKTTVEKLMIFLDKSDVRRTQNSKTYREMYSRLWQFMEFSSGSINVLRSVFAHIDTSQLLSATPSGITKRRSDLTWNSPAKNELFNILFMELSKCYNSSGNDDGTYSLFLENQVLRKGQQKYRFMLNWAILITFHLYYARQSQTQNRSGSEYSVLLGEFIEHLYHTFIGWMESLSSTTLKNLFIPVSQTSLTYKSGVKKLIDSDIKTDATLTPLIKDIQIFLCKNGEKGKREKSGSIRPTTRPFPDKNRRSTPSLAWSPTPPSARYPEHSDSDSDSDSEKHPPPPTTNPPLFRRVSVVPPLTLPSSSSSESKAQSARGSRGTPQPHIPPFATSREHADANRNAGNTLPKYAGSEPAVSTTTKPQLLPIPPEDAERIRNMTFTRRRRPQTPSETLQTGKGTKGGGKRTRKHRSVPSSVPVPASATCRRHHSSSSSQKRTRRRRASIRT